MARSITHRIAKGLAAHLSPAGFHFRSPRQAIRNRIGFDEGFEIQPGTSSLSGAFTVNVFWKFVCAPKSETIQDCSRRIAGFTDSQEDLWLPSDPANVEASNKLIYRIIDSRVLPFFDRYPTIEAMLDAYEHQVEEADRLWGLDEGWRSYNLGFAYLHVGNESRAKAYLERSIALADGHDGEWIMARARTASAAMADL